MQLSGGGELKISMRWPMFIAVVMRTFFDHLAVPHHELSFKIILTFTFTASLPTMSTTTATVEAAPLKHTYYRLQIDQRHHRNLKQRSRGKLHYTLQNKYDWYF
jgi:hypothetical protein